MSDGFAIPKEFVDAYLVDALELVGKIESVLIEMEKHPAESKYFDSVARLLHNLKGSSLTLGFTDLSTFTHEIEEFLVTLKPQLASDLPGETVFDLMLRICDEFKSTLRRLQKDPSAKIDFKNFSKEMKEFSLAENPAETPAETPAAPARSTDALPAPATKTVHRDDNVRIPLKKIDDFLDFFGEQVILQSALDHAKEDPIKNHDLIAKIFSQLNKITVELQQTALSFRMTSLERLYSQMERTCRDTSSALKKKVHFKAVGRENELDKTIVDALADPLTHMIRNSLDHGMESPQERLESGKPEHGTIELRGYRKGSFFYIELEDDGRGLDHNRILSKAIEKGLVPATALLSASEIDQLIFQKGFSTRDTASEISGRGIGMDIVRETLTSLKGTITIHNRPGLGCLFRIRLPLTLTIFNGFSVRVGEQMVIIPNSDVSELVRFTEDERSVVAADLTVINLRDKVYPLIDLREKLGIRKARTSEKGLNQRTAIINSVNSKEYAVLVDEVVSQQRIVHKPLGSDVQAFPGAVGATILNDGSVALILELSSLIAG